MYSMRILSLVNQNCTHIHDADIVSNKCFKKKSNDNSLLKYIYMSMWKVKGSTCNSSRENNIVY